MKIIINGKDAVLKKGTSFEFVAENRSFTGSDSYTLSITFPLRGCPENIAIFGYINRTDIDKSKVVFDCEISDINFYSAGTITIVEVNEKEVKTQFLEGRSEQNFDDTFDEIYINELELGSYPMTSLPSNPFSRRHENCAAASSLRTSVPTTPARISADTATPTIRHKW